MSTQDAGDRPESVVEPRYRVGRSWGVTVVRQAGPEPGDGDELVAMARTRQDADLIVEALNDRAKVQELIEDKEQADG